MKKNLKLNLNNFIAKKKLGQNFLVDNNYVDKIIEHSNISSNDIILEIGPGLGALTFKIANLAKKIVAVELDQKAIDHLNSTTNFPSNLKLVHQDILKLDKFKILELFQEKKINKVISNLPYYISSKVIALLLKMNIFDEIIIMVQKEMAERICASPKTKDYNAFTVFVQIYADIFYLFDVPNTAFLPIPNITSSVIKLMPKKINIEDKIEFEKFIKLCFGQKRKTLTNNLKSIYSKNHILSNLKSIGISEMVRPEELSIKQLIQLYRCLKCK